jgi:hypothetical protein
MEGHHLSGFAQSIRVCRRLLRSRFTKPLSFLIFGVYLYQGAYAEPASFPQASPGYSAKKFYTLDQATLVTALGNTLKALSIPVVSVQNNTITTDYMEGPTTNSGLLSKHTRYKYEIHILPPLFGHVLVNIGATIEASSGPPTGPFGPWQNVTLFSLPSSLMVRDYLSEAFEATLNGGQVHASAQQQTLSASSAAPAGAGSATSGSAAPLGSPLLTGGSGGSSNFDGGLGASGDVGGGTNSAAAPVKTSLPQNRSQ